MPRALSAGELISLRSDGQVCKMYLAVHEPASVFTARLNGVPSSTDKVAEITFDGGSAGFASCLAGQTVYVGSAAGAYDKGMVRLRGTLAGVAGTMKIGETAEIDWADNDYLTVLDEFALWPRHLRITSAGVVYADYDVAYSDQHANCAPVPVLGPPAVKWLTGATVDVLFDGSDSWVVGSTISAYSWAAPGASATSGMATATPTITYNAAGTYRVACTVTAANGKSFTGYRYVFVYDANNQPTTVFRLDDCTGDWQSGGWRLRVTMWDEALRSEIRDRAQVILFAQDWYGGTEESIGPVADRENVVCVGWIAGESIEWDAEQGSVTFEVQGPQFWMGKMTGFPAGVEDYDGTPTTWAEFEDLAVDKGLWHFLHWRTTATLCTDVSLTGDTRQVKVFDAPAGSLWQQITQESERTILARPACDRYGRIFVEIDQNLIPVADRNIIPVVQTITTQDWQGQMGIERKTAAETALLDLSGVAYTGGSATPYFSLSPGHVFKRYGSVQRKERLAFSNQAAANELAGLLAGKANNEYPVIDLRLASNYRAVDICPQQYLQMSVAEADTERGIAFTDYKLIPRRVAFRHDAEAGVLLTEIAVEGYTLPELAVTGDPPPAPPDPPDPPDIPPIPLPPPVALWTGPVKAAILYNGSQIGYTADLLRHQIVSTGKTGTTGTTLIDLLLDDQPGASFEDVGVMAGDVVENITTRAWTTVAAVVSGTELTLTADIGLVATSAYHVCGAQWHDISGGIVLDDDEDILDFVYVRTSDGVVGGWLLTGLSLRFAPNVLTASPNWSEKLSLADMVAELGAAASFKAIAVSDLDPNYCIVNCSTNINWCTWNPATHDIVGAMETSDLGNSWDLVWFDHSIQWGNPPPGGQKNACSLYCGPYSIGIVDGVVYAVRRVYGYPAGNPGYGDVWVDGFITGGMRADGIACAAENYWLGMHLCKESIYEHLVACANPAVAYEVGISGDGGTSFAGINPAGGYTSLPHQLKPTGHYDTPADVCLPFTRDADGDEVLLRSVTSGGAWAEIGNAHDLFNYTPVIYGSTRSIAPYAWEPDPNVLLWMGRAVQNVTKTARRLFITFDGGTQWLNKFGNWYAAMGEWIGNNKGGYEGIVPLPRVGSNE